MHVAHRAKSVHKAGSATGNVRAQEAIEVLAVCMYQTNCKQMVVHRTRTRQAVRITPTTLLIQRKTSTTAPAHGDPTIIQYAHTPCHACESRVCLCARVCFYGSNHHRTRARRPGRARSGPGPVTAADFVPSMRNNAQCTRIAL